MAHPNPQTASARRTTAQGTEQERSGGDTLTFDDELVQGYFCMVSTALAQSEDIGGMAKALYLVLVSYAGNKTVAWPSQETLARKMGVTPKTLRKILGELEFHGLLVINRRGVAVNLRYHVKKYCPHTAPEPSEPVPQTPEVLTLGNARPTPTSNKQPTNRGEILPTNRGEILPTNIDSSLEIDTRAAARRAGVRETPKKTTTTAAASSDFVSREKQKVERKLRDHTPDELEALRRKSARKLIQRFMAEEPAAYTRHKQEILQAGNRTAEAVVGQALKIAWDILPSLASEEQAIEAEKQRKRLAEERNRETLARHTNPSAYQNPYVETDTRRKIRENAERVRAQIRDAQARTLEQAQNMAAQEIQFVRASQ
jgi:hypothetical protein